MTSEQDSTTMDRVYELISGDDEDARACKDIPDEACEELPRSFVLNVLNGVSTKLAEQLASPGLVLPWLLGSIGAPAVLTGWLVPVRRAGSLLPQLLVAGSLRRMPQRKWAWTGAGVAQALSLLGMAAIAASASPAIAGVGIVLLLAVFSVASGVGSVAFSDVVGKTIPRGRRGRMLAFRAFIGGALATGAGVLLRQLVSDDADLTPFLVLLISAAGLWIIGSVLFAAIPERSGATEGGENAIHRAIEGLAYLKRDRALRRFVLVYALLTSIELAMPFVTLIARDQEERSASDLGLYLIAVSAAAVLSSPVWGRLADKASPKVMAAGGAIGLITLLGAWLLPTVETGAWTPWLFGGLFLLLGLAHGGVRLGRKTYLLDIAPSDLKGSYKAVANTIVGTFALAMGSLGWLSAAFGERIVLLTLAGASLFGVLLALWLPTVSEANGNDSKDT